MQIVTLNIGGMSCDGCVKSVTRILGGIDGANKAEVSLENKNTAVTSDPVKTNPNTLIEAVEGGGFDASR